MKKILTLFAVIGLIAFSSCEGPEGPPGPPGRDGIGAEAFEIEASFSFNTTDGYIISDSFSKYLGGDLFQDESVLVYRLEGTNNANSDVWQLIPRDVYFENGESITYDYNFSKQAFTIFVGGDNIANRPNFINNQVFRFVIIPADFGTGKSVNKVDFSDYNAVIKKYNIDDSNVKKFKI
ncbi:hypothetical protein BD847_0275 [Flavobacterium cutihirudinis]|uniref:Collagen-like protein n=1 Tax=Flavobacterium cutihirudinis TaxID=1265740 RepID=A0A3D9G1A5_9FLAO|nr:hypothetical protein [Flavobacterium cutihirudinis]RED26357.1 hypothetical protein BD847_0275 [Flavobacterium cutihirudinis]